MRHYIEREDGVGPRKRFNSFNLAREACKAGLTNGRLLKITDPRGDELFPPLGTLPVSTKDVEASDRYLGEWYRQDNDVWNFQVHPIIESLGRRVEREMPRGLILDDGYTTNVNRGLEFKLTDGKVTVWFAYGLPSRSGYGYDADIVVEGGR